MYLTSSADVADLIDHLSRDLEASRGRIDIHPPSTQSSHSPPFQYGSTNGHSPHAGDVSSTYGQFEDAPSPHRGQTAPSFAQHRVGGIVGSGQLPPNVQQKLSNGVQGSPSAASFTSSTSGFPGRSVEERLQSLLDRLREGGVSS